MSARTQYLRRRHATVDCSRVGFFSVVIVLNLAVAQQDAAGSRCVDHEDCAAGEFCKAAECDSYEGWTFVCSFCRSCNECMCDGDSSTGSCPDTCLGTPLLRVRELEGTFIGTARLNRESWNGDACLTTLTVRASYFRMVSFRVDKSLYAMSPASLPEFLGDDSPSLCDFPDSPGLTEGSIESLPITSPDMMARLRLTYHSGLPPGIERVISIFDACPSALTLHFEPISWVPIHYMPTLGLAPLRYTYVSGVAECPLCVSPMSGYRFNQKVESGIVKLTFKGTTAGYRELVGSYSGFFVFGSTRQSEDDLGEFPGMICNSTWHFESGQLGIVQFDEYTWGCRVWHPPLMSTKRQRNFEHQEIAFVDKPLSTRRQKVESPPKSFVKDNMASYKRVQSLRASSPDCPSGKFSWPQPEPESVPGDPGPSKVFSPEGCRMCPVGRYSNLAGSTMCFSCSNGFTNALNGSESLADCCVQQKDVGLYNDHAQTTYNIFGYFRTNMGKMTRPAQESPRHATVFGRYYSCPDGHSYTSPECVVSEQNISTAPVTNQSNVGEAPEIICSDVKFTVQPTIEGRPVSAVIALDFWCKSCIMDLGPKDEVIISLYRFNEATTLMPDELKFRKTRLPSSDFRDFLYAETSDYSRDFNYPIFHFNNTHQPPKASDGDSRLFISPQLPINHTLAAFNAMIEQKQARYACDYEDPGGTGVRGLQSPPRSPKCADEFSKRIQILDDLTFNNYTPIGRVGRNLSSPVIFGLRILARVHNGTGFKIGYSFSRDHGKCRPGWYANIYALTDVQCVPCAPGTFTPTDQSTYCFECPKGTYTDMMNSTRCLPCPMGYSTPRAGSSKHSDCKSYCRAGSYSSTGLEPCLLCPRNSSQDKVGATFSDPCPSNSITVGATGAGFTSIDPWSCMDSTNLQFLIERFDVVGQQITMIVTWRIPEQDADVNDLIVVIKDDPWTSLRQLRWAYASAAAIDGEVICSGWIGDSCLHPGSIVKPWASILFEIDIAGDGTYSAVYFSSKKGIRILSSTYFCDEKQCPFDLGPWETDTGLYVCKPGQYSETDGTGPCFPCPNGTFSNVFASQHCSPCEVGLYSGFSNGDLGSAANRISMQTQSEGGGSRKWAGDSNQGLVGVSVCIKCPDGMSTIATASVFEGCLPCEDIYKVVPENVVAGCAPRKVKVGETTAFVATTPAPDTCGDGRKVTGSVEECDDGNTKSLDGCSSDCRIEIYWKCMKSLDAPDQCFPSCGDGVMDQSTETCDDGNTEDGDGCTSLCAVQAGWKCIGVLGERSRCSEQSVCANQEREWEKGEECDDGDLFDGDGCSALCTIENGYACTNYTNLPDACCATLQLCGNGILDRCEQCDDGNPFSNDGCSPSCQSELLFKCRDGCSGPLCFSEDFCSGGFVGKHKQKGGLDTGRWLGINDAVREIGFDTKAFQFLIPDKGSNLVSDQSGIFFDVRPGPRDTGIMHIFGSPKENTWSESFGFKGIYGLGCSPMQVAPTFCSGSKILHWPSGTISEARGEMANNRDCTFVFTGGAAIMELLSLNRMVIVTIESLDFDRDDEILTINYDGYTIGTFRKDSQVPAEMHLPAYCELKFSAQTHLHENIEWNPVPDGLRFKITFRTVILNEQGRRCQLSCIGDIAGIYDEECVRSKECASFSRDVDLDGIDSILDLGANFGNADRQRRTLDEDTDVQNKVHRDAPRRKLAHCIGNGFGHLVMTLSAYSSTSMDLPRMFAQETQNTLMSLDKGNVWTGMNGAWAGNCNIAPSCSGERTSDDVACILLSEYDTPSNVCSIRFDISDRVIREYRSNCAGGSNSTGIAHGVIIEINNYEEVQLLDTGVAVLRYRRADIMWTKSTLLDRPLGVRIKAFITFGFDSDVDSKNPRMQILLGNSIGGTPSLEVDAALQLFASRYGSCRRIELSQSNSIILLASPSRSYLNSKGKAGLLRDLQRYYTCNSTLQQLQALEYVPDCRSLLETVLYRDITTKFTVPVGTCENPCLERVQTLLERSKRECHLNWKGEFLSGKLFKNRIYKKLHLVGVASLFANVMCKKNHLGENCVKSIYDFSVLFDKCPLFSNRGGEFRAPFSAQRKKSATSDTCPQACFDALQRYQVQYGCCAASTSKEAIELAEYLTDGDTFLLDLGITRNPWTDLGSGSGQAFGELQDCESGTSVFSSCMVQDPKYCNRSAAWREPCCTFKCINNGSLAYPGDCYCSCPSSMTGSRCQIKSAHVRVDMMFAGESTESFNSEKVHFVIKGTSDLAVVDQVTRILLSDQREVQRLAQKLSDAFENGRLQESIANASCLSWKFTLTKGKYGPIPFNAYGRELCDGVTVICQLLDDLDFNQTGTSSSAGLQRVTRGKNEIVMIALSATFALLISFVIGGFWYRWWKRKQVFEPGEVKQPSAIRRLLPRKREHRRQVEAYSNFEFNTESSKGDKIVTDKVSGFFSKGKGRSIASESLVNSKNRSKDDPLDMSEFKIEKKIVDVSSETSLFLSAAVEYEDASKPPTETQTQQVMGKLFQIKQSEPEKRREYHYDASTLEQGFRDVDEQRAQILNRLKYLKTLQNKGPAPRIGTPSLLQDTAADNNWSAFPPAAEGDAVWKAEIDTRSFTLPHDLKDMSKKVSLMNLYPSNASSQHTKTWSSKVQKSPSSMAKTATGDPLQSHRSFANKRVASLTLDSNTGNVELQRLQHVEPSASQVAHGKSGASREKQEIVESIRVLEAAAGASQMHTSRTVAPDAMFSLHLRSADDVLGMQMQSNLASFEVSDGFDSPRRFTTAPSAQITLTPSAAGSEFRKSRNALTPSRSDARESVNTARKVS